MARVVAASAWCNNEVAYLAWSTDEKISDCLGFMITRIRLDDHGNVLDRRLLPSWAAFTTQSNPKWIEQDTSIWPIQKFSWRDLTLRRSRDTTDVRPAGFRVSYEIVPVGRNGPGRPPVPTSSTATPGGYTGAPIPLFICGESKTTDPIAVTTQLITTNGKTIVSAGFTNGILSTQNLRQQLKTESGKIPSKAQLTSHIFTDKPDPIRTFLAADALSLISGFMGRAEEEKCDLYCALYELNDPTLLDLLKSNASCVHLILSTAGSTKPAKGSGDPVVWDGTNKASRAALRGLVTEFHDRMFNNSAHIGHNKFAVLVDRVSGKAKAVLAGSTNWTFTGLCTQTNNVVIIDDEGVAEAYFAYWKRLRDDNLPEPAEITAEALSAPNRNKQGQKLRTDDKKPDELVLPDAGKTAVELWYSPNTTAVTKGTATPPDLGAAFKLMSTAKEAIFFLTFMPSVRGDNSIISQAITAAQSKPDLLVLGAISDGRALPDDASSGGAAAVKAAAKAKPSRKKTSQAAKAKPPRAKAAKIAPAKGKSAKSKARKAAGKARTGKKKRTVAMAVRESVKRSTKASAKKGSATKAANASGKIPQPKRAIYTNPKAPKVLMVRAAAIGAFDLIGDWEHEMLRYGQAIIHDKIVVIDPLSENCTVITGSHNLGFKASYANDENMLIIRGNRALAIAYAVHVLDVYEHYKWRAVLEQQAYERSIGMGPAKPPVNQGILKVDDTWQDPYFSGRKGQEREYLLGAKSP